MMLVETIILSILVSLADCQCNGDRTSGDYTASWNVRTGGTSVQFNVSVPALLNTWVAVGFSSSGNMINSDIVIASSDGGGGSFVEDRWAFSRKMPTYDTDQDIWDTSVTFVNGSLSMSFIRNIYTLKENDYRLDRCVHVLGAWGGQVMSYSSPSQFSKHSSMTVFDQLMCLQSCSDYVPPSISSTTSAVGATSSTSMPPETTSTKSETSSGGLSTTYIIVIAVIGFLVLVAVSLFVILCCIWLVGSKTRRVMTTYELNQMPVPHPATRRETMQKQQKLSINLPNNDYQEEEIGHHLYDEVPREHRIPEARPDSFYEGEVQYDQPPNVEPEEPTEYYKQPPPNYKAPPPPPQDPVEYYEHYIPPNPNNKQPTRQDAYEHMQCDGIRHILN